MSRTPTTHQATFDGSRTLDFTDDFRSHRAQIGYSLSRLTGGEDAFAYKLGAYPPGLKSITIPDGWRPPQYIQCGGSAEALAIEVRIVGDDGVARQFAVGRGGDRGSEPSVRIPYGDGHGVTVFPDEVFEQEEAGDIFYRYFQTGSVGEQYTLRELDLGAPA